MKLSIQREIKTKENDIDSGDLCHLISVQVSHSVRNVKGH